MRSFSRRIRGALLLVVATSVALFLWDPPLAAQYTTASLAGNVVDPTGAMVPDAQVTVRNTETGFEQTVSTGATGAFLFPRLPVGVYQLRVEKSGFSTYVQEGITLTVNQSATQTVTLKVGEVSEKVTVAGDAELVTTGTATVGQLVDEKRVVDLPLNGRTVQSLVFLAAGTVDVTDRYCGLGCHGGVYPGEQQAAINGAGPGGVNYQLDGAGHNDTYLNTNLPFPNPDAVQEFNLQSDNITAEYGNAVGGTVNIVTKSGTNEIHGSAFEFLRNGNLNARNFFAEKHDSLKRNQFGGSIGGPILKDKLFFFGTFQGTRIRSAPGGQITFVPTQAERNGDFSSLLPGTQLIDPVTKVLFPNNQIPADRLSPVAKYFMQFIPLPNGPGRKLSYTGPRDEQTENQFMPKIDYIRGKHQISGRYYFTDFDEPPLIQKDSILAATGQGNAVRVQNLAVSHTYTFSPTFLTNSWFGWNQQRGGSLSSAPFSFPDAGAKIGAPTPPELSLDVSGGFSINTNHLGDFDRGDWTVRENVTAIRGAHELHFGGEAVRVKNHLVNTFLMAGYYGFFDQLSGDNLADFLLGQASFFQQGGGEFKRLVGTRWGSFAQDNWRVNQKLTLNLGLRWDPYFPYQERDGRVTCFQPGQKSQRYPNAPVGLTYGGENHDPTCPAAGSDNNLGNFAPRVGFAYRLTQDGKTSLRGGAGYYYIPPQTSVFNLFVDTAPFSPQFTFSAVSFEDPYGSAGVQNPFPEQYGPRIPGSDVTFTTPTALYGVFQKDFHIPLLTTWNLTLERQLGADWVVRAAYVGNKGTFLSNDQKALREANPAVYVPGASTIENTQDRRIYRDFSTVGLVSSSNNSKYHGLQLNLEKRFSHGLSLLTNYTWSKSIDDYGWTNPFNRSFDYGRSDDDITHIFKFSNVWELPKLGLAGVPGKLLNGWVLNSIVTWRGGFPFTVYSGNDNSFSGVNRDRANFLGGKAQLSSDRSHGELIEQFFNTALFVPNAEGTFGNSGKNNLRGPRFFNTDFGLLKTTRVNERTSVQFRAELFNIFNNVNFGQPDNVLSDGPEQFGHIFTAGSPRILQFALKFLF
jgi:Carboxypeptidase regulatory-like domain/TonB dependent receptor